MSAQRSIIQVWKRPTFAVILQRQKVILTPPTKLRCPDRRVSLKHQHHGMTLAALVPDGQLFILEPAMKLRQFLYAAHIRTTRGLTFLSATCNCIGQMARKGGLYFFT